MDGSGIVTAAADIASVFAGYAATQPHAAAILAPGRAPLTYGNLYDRIVYVRGALQGWNIGSGDPVALLLPKGPEMAAAIAAVSCCATAVPLDMKMTEAEYESLLARIGAKAMILPSGLSHCARDVAERAGMRLIELVADPASPAGTFELFSTGAATGDGVGRNLGSEYALIITTSGTTSERKLIPNTHSHVIDFARASRMWLEYRPGDLALHLVPMVFANGVKSSLLAPLLNGTAIVCPTDYTAERFFRLLDDYLPTYFSAGFTVFRDILRHLESHRDVIARARLRFIRSDSGRLEPEEIARLEQAFNAPMIVGLGVSEVGWTVGNPLPPAVRKPDSVGRKLTNDVRIRSFDGDFAAAGEEGEIVVRGPSVFHGYLGDPASTADAFVDGWFRTGDLGKMDADGFLFLTGRIKDVINSGGVKISPAEIDAVLQSHPAVLEAAAVGLPHRTLGEIVVAAAVPAPGGDIDAAALAQYCRARLAGPRAPRKIFLVECLPRNGSGKLLRNKLREALVA